jgi:hypothetical protein
MKKQGYRISIVALCGLHRHRRRYRGLGCKDARRIEGQRGRIR